MTDAPRPRKFGLKPITRPMPRLPDLPVLYVNDEEVFPGSIAAAEAALDEAPGHETSAELVEEIERLRESCEKTEADYHRAASWHLTLVSALIADGKPIPEGVPDPAAFYVNSDDGYAWLYHLTDPESDEVGHSVGIEITGGTTLADLVKAVLAHRCD